MKKRVLAVLVAGMMLFTCLAMTANAQDDIKVTLNGKRIQFDVAPQIIDNRTMIPTRAISEALGADVHWIPEAVTVVVVKDEKKLLMTVDYPILAKLNIPIGASVEEIKSSQDIEEIALDVPATIVGDRVLVPMRAICEALGIEVRWDQGSSTAIMTCPPEYIQNKNTDKEFFNKLMEVISELIED